MRSKKVLRTSSSPATSEEEEEEQQQQVEQLSSSPLGPSPFASRKPQTRFTSTSQNFKRIGPLILYHIVFMSLFYQVMGAARCPKIKKHAGIKLRPINKAKEPFTPGDLLIYSCETTEYTQSIKCLDDGKWSDIPHCPDPSDSTCPALAPLLHGTYNNSGPYKVGTVVIFKCENEFKTENQSVVRQAVTTNSNGDVEPLGYYLTGQRLLKCLPSSKWSHQQPTCSPILPESQSNVTLMLTSALLILIPILIVIAIIQLFLRWRRRQQQRARWKQYFTDYKYRHSKTSITFGTRPQSSTATIPVTDL